MTEATARIEARSNMTRGARTRSARLGVLLLSALAALPLAVVPQTAQAQQGVLTGRVVDYDGQPIAGAEVTVSSATAKGITTWDGTFELSGIPTGLYYYGVRKEGFHPVADLLRFNEGQVLDITLERVEPTKKRDAAEVQSRADAAWQRDLRRYAQALDAARFGNVLTEQDIKDRKVTVTTDLFQTMAGFSVVGGGGGARVVGSRAGCLPAIFVDGTLLRGYHVNDISPRFIKLLVAYRGASTIPPQYQDIRANANCGTIAIFTI